MKQLLRIITLGILAFCLHASAAGEYTARHLYQQPDADATGGIRVQIAAESPRPSLVVAVGRRSGHPWLARHQEDGSWLLEQLPVDRYDLLIITAEGIYEGMGLLAAGQGEVPAEVHDALAAEVAKIEGFFDQKRIHRIGWAEGRACVLVQQWREAKALRHSGARVEGSIHSLDLIWFEKPKTGWQLTRRRQLYREELDAATALPHQHRPALGGIRVLSSIKTVGPFDLNP